MKPQEKSSPDMGVQEVYPSSHNPTVMSRFRKLTRKLAPFFCLPTFAKKSQPSPKILQKEVLTDESTINSSSGISTTSPLTLEIIIIGAGLGGLAAAIAIAKANPKHKITILEQAHVMGEVGAGIQVPPNSSKLLTRWGLRDALAKESVLPRKFIIRRYQNGELLSGYYGLVDEDGSHGGGCEKHYGGPYWLIHRADYHRALMEKALELGVEIKLNSRVESVITPAFSRNSLCRPIVHLANNTTLTADLVIGADGLKSRCREILLGHPDPPYNTGNLAYRILVRASDIQKYEEERAKKGLGPNDPGSLSIFMGEPMTIFAGPDAHAVCYLLKGGGLYNIVLCCPDNLPQGQNIAPANLDEMMKLFENWDPRLKALLSIACDQEIASSSLEPGTEVLKSHSTLPTMKVQKWRLQNSRELPTWTHPSGTFTLMGDACHATLPYLAQGAAMAIEDAAVLGVLIGKIQSKFQIPDILSIYEKLRKARTTKVVQGSTRQRDVIHMPDGPQQIERDRQMKMGEEKVLNVISEGRWEQQDAGKVGNPWADKEFRDWLFGYDADREAEMAWERYLEDKRVKVPMMYMSNGNMKVKHSSVEKGSVEKGVVLVLEETIAKVLLRGRARREVQV